MAKQVIKIVKSTRKKASTQSTNKGNPYRCPNCGKYTRKK